MSERLFNIGSALKKENRVEQLRRTSKLNTKQLFDCIFPQYISKHFDDVYSLVRDNAAIFQHPDIEELNRNELRALSARQVMKILTSLKIDLEKDPYRFLACMYALAFFGLGTSIKGLVHYLLYIKTLLVFQMNSYHKQCIQRANKNLDIGSFSLTEMYHGSFSKGIATVALYDHPNKQFVINTNGQQGMKFWIGNTSQTANKTILWAQLIVQGVNYGPHPFIMPLRDDQTHQVLKGIIIGDCGNKNGLNIIDNGYIIIKDFRIPVQALLGKLGHVDQSGKYITAIKSNQQRFGLHMSPLSSGRANLSTAGLSPSIASLTIAIRYACQRRQFKVDQNVTDQTLIIDYPITKYRLMVPLATNIVYYFAGININKLYVENASNFTDPAKRIVSELHAVSAVLKAKTTWFSNSAITECREALGGHGYSAFSRLGSYYNENDVNSTWEGDNNMLLQQTSKYLIKTIKSKDKTSLIDFSFVHDGFQQIQPTEESLNNLPNLKLLLQYIFTHRHATAVKQMSRLRHQIDAHNKQTHSKQSPESIQAQIWNKLQPYFCNEMALSYGDLIYFQSMYKVIEHYKGSQHNKNFLMTCLKVWTQGVLNKNSVEDINTRKILQTLIVQGCQVLYPDCIRVTDALSPPSYVIGSPFAQENGEGMKSYINMIFTGKKTFGRVPWFEKLLKLKQSNN